MKRLLTIIIALLLTVLTAATLPVQVFADSTSEKYISEIRVGMGKKASEAESSLSGYEILRDDDGKPVDLNKNAGGGTGSKGQKVVYLGYKKTSEKSEAITDLAVMNMKGGYKTDDYDALMNTYMKSQIIPFVDSFLAAIREYRENYNSSNPANKKRAEYICNALNSMTDDDCGGAGLGDLLLNETKYEMGDAAYNALSASEKKKHADIVTIVAQANGRATLMMENLLLKAADSNDTTWTERLSDNTYEDLLDETGLSYSKAKREVAKIYDDDAARLLEMWDAFKAQLDGYDNAIAKLEELKNVDLSEEKAIVENFDFTNATDEQIEAYAEASAKISTNSEMYFSAFNVVLCKEYLETVEYDLSEFDLDGETLLDLFTLDYETVAESPECLYPVVASLSAGQRSGLDLTTLQDLVILGMVDFEGYKNDAYDNLQPCSIYEGVDRGIYEKGSVGLTSDALRDDALSRMAEETDGFKLGAITYASISLLGAAAIGLGVSLAVRNAVNKALNSQLEAHLNKVWQLTDALETTRASRNYAIQIAQDQTNAFTYAQRRAAIQTYTKIENSGIISEQEAAVKTAQSQDEQLINSYKSRSTMCSKLAVGFTVAIIVITAISLWMTFREMQNYYKVDFTPAPQYMVDEKDITAFNSKGEKIVIKNQAAYYKAAQCNRKTDAEYFNVLAYVADLNGDVGRQWLALYAERNEKNEPILAGSFKVSNGESIPGGYEKGIHMFGSAAVENLNNPLYVWNESAPMIFVYYKVEKTEASTAGTSFKGGSLAMSGFAGAAIGAIVTAIGMTTSRKKKEKADA